MARLDKAALWSQACWHDRMGMKPVSKFDGTLLVKSQLFKPVKGMLSVTGTRERKAVSKTADY
eukprot:228752-Pelagomonas_calceolata.AAC.1